MVPLLAKKAVIGSIRGGLEELQSSSISRGSFGGTLGGNLGGTIQNMPKFKDILGEQM